MPVEMRKESAYDLVLLGTNALLAAVIANLVFDLGDIKRDFLPRTLDDHHLLHCFSSSFLAKR